MPRKPQAPISAPGRNSSRTDLSPALPVQVAKDQAYGQRQAMTAAQQSIPLRPAPSPASTSPLPPGAVPASGMPSFDLAAPTSRPAEPVTTAPPAPATGLADALAKMAQTANSEDILELARQAQMLGL